MERDISADVKIVNNFISTHTLTWSVTNQLAVLVTLDNDFNSHAHVERDGEIVRNWINAQSISTHTLTWSVTLKISANSSMCSFQLTRSRGA